MNRVRNVILVCAALLLHGCFDNADNTTKNNTDGSKSSVQMQKSDSRSSSDTNNSK